MAPSLESSSSLIWPTITVALVLAGAAGLGQLVVWPAASGKRQALQSPLLRIAVGLNLVGLIGILLGAAGLLSGSNSLWLLVGLALIGAFAVRFGSLNGARPTPRWLLIAALMVSGVTLGPALCPPTGWDELVYHHVLPRRWQADVWPVFYADLPYSGFPSLGEILFWLMAPLDSLIAPHLLTWTCWVNGCLLLYRLLRRRLQAVSAAVLVAALAFCSTSLLITANCYVETIQFMNFVAMLLVIDDRRAAVESPWRSVVAIGVLAGGVAAVKLTGLAIVATAILWYLVAALFERSRKERHGGRSLQQGAICLLVAACVALPFYLRPWLLTGNPFYPYYSHWFSGDPARVEMSRFHHALGSRFGDHSPAALVINLVRLAFDHPAFDGDFGWQWLIVLGLAILGMVWTRRRLTPFMWFAVLAFCWLYLFWFFTAQQARFALPAVLAVMPLAALGLKRFHGWQRKLVLVALLAATIFSAPWRTTGRYVGAWLTALGVVSRADYVKISTDADYALLTQALQEHTPPDARLMLFFEHRSFYLPRACVIGTPFFQEQSYTPPEGFADTVRFMEVLARERITHVVMPNRPTGPDQAPAWHDRLAPFFAGFNASVEQGKLRSVWQSDRYVLLEVW